MNSTFHRKSTSCFLLSIVYSALFHFPLHFEAQSRSLFEESGRSIIVVRILLRLNLRFSLIISTHSTCATHSGSLHLLHHRGEVLWRNDRQFSNSE